ncbi:MAG: ATP-binding protein [Thermoleophilia bacterium]
MSMDNHSETVSIAVPPRDLMSGVVRIATSAVSSRTGLNIDQTDDLNTAIEELFQSFVSRNINQQTDFCVKYYIYPDRLEIVAEGCLFPDDDVQVGRYSRFLLASLSDRMKETPNPAGGCDITLIKLLSSS